MSATVVLLLLGQLQGWLLAFALLSMQQVEPGRRAALRWLASLLICLAVTLNVPLFQELGIWQQWPRSLLLLSGLPFLFGPLLLGHVASQTGQSGWLAPRWWLLHALLPVGFYLLILPLLWRSTPELQQLLTPPLADDQRFSLVPSLKHLSFVAYSVVSLWLLQRYERRLRDQLAEVEPYTLRWLRLLVWSALLLVLALAVVWVTGWSADQHDMLLASALSLLIVAAGFHGLRRTPVFAGEDGDNNGSDNAGKAAPAEAEQTAADHRPLLAPAGLQALQAQLDTIADNEPLLFDHGLSLNKLAVAMQVSPHQLSWALNQVRGQSFYDYINAQRVQAVQRRLSDPAYASLPILDIALGCGFANKTTFNKAFKALTGITPSAWRAAKPND